MSVHLPVYKDAPSDGLDYVRKDGEWQVSSGAGGPVGAATLQSGFDDRTDSVMSFTDATRTFSIAPVATQFDIYQKGTLYEITSEQTIVIPDAEGLHYIYFNAGSLASTQTFSEEIITEYVFACAVYWNAADNESIIVGEERHGREMDSATHLYLHETASSQYGYGFALTNISSDGTGNSASDAQFGMDGGEFWDEDIRHTVISGATQTLASPAEIPILYRSGNNGDWKKIPATTYPITTTGTGRAAWNEWTGTTWQLSEVANTDFVLMHYVVTNDINEPVMAVMGDNTYGNIAAAREGAAVEIAGLQFGELAPLTPEFIPVATVIWQTSNVYSNAVKSRIRTTDSGDDYIDWREASASGTGSTGSGITDPDAIHKSVANEITGITEKASPVSGDWLLLEDSAASFVKKGAQIGNLPFATDAHEHALSDLTDVNTSIATNRNVLVADGVDWESRPLVEADISDFGSYAVDGHSHSEYAPLSGPTFTGNVAFSAGKKITAPQDLTLEQTGDTFGTTQLILKNRSGFNGAEFKNLGIDLVDFIFTPSTTASANIRYEGRASATQLGVSGEFGIGAAGSPTIAISNRTQGVKVFGPLQVTSTVDGVDIAAFKSAYDSHNHSGVYEPAFSKNTAFNKNFGTTAGTVAQGNHTHANGTVVLAIACSDESSDLAAGTAVATFRVPLAFTVSEVRCSVTTAPVGSTLIVDINESGTSILSTKLSIDANEKTSETATSSAVISDTSLADDAEITIDIDQVGSTTPGSGLKVYLVGSET